MTLTRLSSKRKRLTTPLVEDEMKEFSNLRSMSEDHGIDFEPIDEEEIDEYIKASEIVLEAQEKYSRNE